MVLKNYFREYLNKKYENMIPTMPLHFTSLLISLLLFPLFLNKFVLLNAHLHNFSFQHSLQVFFKKIPDTINILILQSESNIIFLPLEIIKL